ncbi:WD40-repeat-containing domain protein [Umbelopsis sp. AD052]|nr:WD40-repeat-containing domain protein [Umbelopsis sp. AD052]
MSFEQSSNLSQDHTNHSRTSSSNTDMGQNITVPRLTESELQQQDSRAAGVDEHTANSQDDGESIISDSAATVSSRATSTHPNEHETPTSYYQTRSLGHNTHHYPTLAHSPSASTSADHVANMPTQSMQSAERYSEHKTEPFALASEVPVSASPRESSPLRHSFTNEDHISNTSPSIQRTSHTPQSHQGSISIPRQVAANHRWANPSLLVEASFASLDDTAPPYDGYPFLYGNSKKIPFRIPTSPRNSMSPPRYRDGRPDASSSRGSQDSVDIIDTDDIKCQICLDNIREAFITRCGHSFCYKCIVEHLNHHQSCPTCQNTLLREHIYPNFQLNKIVQKATAFKSKHHVGSKRHTRNSSAASMDDVHQVLDERTLASDISSLIASGVNGLADLDAKDVDNVLQVLIAKKRQMLLEEKSMEAQILKEFLLKVKQQKQQLLERVSTELACIDGDLATVQADIQQDRTLYPENDEAESSDVDRPAAPEVPDDRARSLTFTGKKRKMDDREASPEKYHPKQKHPRLDLQRQRMDDFFGDLQECYFNMRMTAQGSRQSLVDFSSTINKFAKHSQFKVVATLRYGDISSTSSIVSAIEFDRDDEYFATAGVTKKIKIFEYANIEQENFEYEDDHRSEEEASLYSAHNSEIWPRSITNYDGKGGGLSNDTSYVGRSRNTMETVMQYPIKEMVCRQKISCLSWNSYIKNQMASSDYEGVVSIWDATVGQLMQSFDEHKRRTWSVDYSRVDPTLLASGSDDSTVKIWSINQRNSVCTIEKNANICCVKFLPTSSHYIAMGSADHHIHYYDLRNTKEPVSVFRGHRKAVSYVKWLNEHELVSASTDSTLKLWNIRDGECVRTYTGHVNEKNFVGLSSNSDWISCGSENNAVYTYYKSFRSPLACVKFGGFDPLTGHSTEEDDPSQFVSSVCWKRNSNTLLSANSQGTIKVMALV